MTFSGGPTEVESLAQKVDRIQDRLTSAVGRATSRSGDVAAAVNARGLLVDLRIRDGGASDDLAYRIMATVNEAHAAAADIVRDVVAEFRADPRISAQVERVQSVVDSPRTSLRAVADDEDYGAPASWLEDPLDRRRR